MSGDQTNSVNWKIICLSNKSLDFFDLCPDNKWPKDLMSEIWG